VKSKNKVGVDESPSNIIVPESSENHVMVGVCDDNAVNNAPGERRGATHFNRVGMAGAIVGSKSWIFTDVTGVNHQQTATSSRPLVRMDHVYLQWLVVRIVVEDRSVQSSQSIGLINVVFDHDVAQAVDEVEESVKDLILDPAVTGDSAETFQTVQKHGDGVVTVAVSRRAVDPAPLDRLDNVRVVLGSPSVRDVTNLHFIEVR
jgi:hypothetical protein